MTRVPRRKPIFVGCEGASERSYAAFLKLLADSLGLHVQLETRDLGGGDAATALGRAICEFRKYRNNAGRTTPGFVLLDLDRVDGKRVQIEADASRANLTLIWQDPCHEALLLRHFAGQELRQPHDSEAAMQALRTLWPTYLKNSPAIRIAEVLNIDHVRRAAGVTPALQALLDQIKL